MALDLLISIVYLTLSGAAGLALMSWLVTHDFYVPRLREFILSNRFKTLFSSRNLLAALVLAVGIVVLFVFAKKVGHPTANAPRPSFSILEMIQSLGAVALGVVITLLIMSVYSIAIMIERYLTYSAAKKAAREFAPRVASALKHDRIEEAINISDTYYKSHLATVVMSGLQEFQAHEQSSDLSEDDIEASKRALQRAIAIKTAEFKRGLSGLATIGSTAPFIGLFGTVFGIINAFSSMGNAGESGIGAVAAGISEALFTTALGLIVAVPAVWLFNYFTGKVDGFIVEMDKSAIELVEYFSTHRTRSLSRDR